jgi:hypothetical protein
MLRQAMTFVVCISAVVGMVSSSEAAEPSGVRHVSHHGGLSHHGGCGCDHQLGPVSDCGECRASCRPCCPPLIPALLRGVDRLLQRIFCCSSCGSRCIAVGARHTPSCGCDSPVVAEDYMMEGIITEQHGAFIPSSNQRYAPAHQRPTPKRAIRETQLEGHSIIKRTSFQSDSPVPSRLKSVNARPIPSVRRIPTAEVSRRTVARPQPKAPVGLENPLRD